MSATDFAWMDQAACVGQDPDIWFDRRWTLAKQTCAGCPVAARCEQYGEGAWRGVWAGESHTAKQVGPSPTLEYISEQHGTDAGYSQHIRAGTPPCGRCSTAHTFANREYDERIGRVSA